MNPILLRIFVQFSLALHKLVKGSYRGPTSFVNDLPNTHYFAYGRRCVEDYLAIMDQAGITMQSNAKVLEVGTGKSPVVAVLMASKGMDVTSLDRFNNIPNLDDAVAAVGEELGVETVKIGDGNFVVGDGRAQFIIGAVEKYRPEGEDCFDFVLSRATLEHFTDLGCGIDALKARSRDGAVHVHEIDHRDHGIFSHFKIVSNMWFHKISDSAWRPLLDRFPGLPNKVNALEVGGLFVEAGFQSVSISRRTDGEVEDNHSCVMLDYDIDEKCPVSVVVAKV